MKYQSGMQHGTLQQLKNLINRRNVPKEPKKDFNASEDFFTVIVTSHILCVAMEHLDMETLDTVPARGNVKMKRIRTHLVANSNAFAFTTPK